MDNIDKIENVLATLIDSYEREYTTLMMSHEFDLRHEEQALKLKDAIQSVEEVIADLEDAQWMTD